MKKNLVLISVVFIVLAFGFQSASAQFTITIPKIPKIKKDKSQQPKQDTPSENQSNENQNNQSNGNQTNQSNQTQTTESKPSAPPDKCSPSTSLWLGAHLDEIAERQKEVDSFTPDRGWFTKDFTYDHLL